VALLCTAGIGCSVPFGSSAGEHNNVCQSSDDCSEDGSAYCSSEGICVATNVQLDGLYFEIRPSSGAAYGANRSFLLGGPATGTFVTGTFDVQLPALVKFPVEVLEPSCSSLPDRAVPAYVTLFQDSQYAGPSTDTLQLATTRSSSSAPYSFDVTLVANAPYDVYIEPQPTLGCNSVDAAATVTEPPQFLPAQTFDATIGKFQPSRPQPPVTLTGTITDFPSSAVATNWMVDVVEPLRGLPISVSPRRSYSPDPSSLSISFSLQVSWQDDAILRLTPILTGNELAVQPNDQLTRPTVYWTLNGAAAPPTTSEGPWTATLSMSELQMGLVAVTGTVRSTTGTGVNAQLFVQSTTLTGPLEDIAAVSLHNVLTSTLQQQPTDPPGSFTLWLPPGDYQLQAVPPLGQGDLAPDGGAGAPYGVSQTVSFSVPTGADPQAPDDLNPVSLGSMSLYHGDIEGPSPGKLSNVPLSMVPFAPPPATYGAGMLPSALVATGLTTTAIWQQDGTYRLWADQAVAMSLLVQPPPTSGYPWLVCPNNTLPADSDTDSPLLIPLPFPTLVSGTVSDPSRNPVANAAVYAWYPYLDSSMSSDQATLAVQLAATTTGEDGTYQLVLPPAPSWSAGACPQL
jgi:hypothetical protein